MYPSSRNSKNRQNTLLHHPFSYRWEVESWSGMCKSNSVMKKEEGEQFIYELISPNTTGCFYSACQRTDNKRLLNEIHFYNQTIYTRDMLHADLHCRALSRLRRSLFTENSALSQLICYSTGLIILWILSCVAFSSSCRGNFWSILLKTVP